MTTATRIETKLSTIVVPLNPNDAPRSAMIASSSAEKCSIIISMMKAMQQRVNGGSWSLWGSARVTRMMVWEENDHQSPATLIPLPAVRRQLEQTPPSSKGALDNRFIVKRVKTLAKSIWIKYNVQIYTREWRRKETPQSVKRRPCLTLQSSHGSSCIQQRLILEVSAYYAISDYMFPSKINSTD